MKCSTDQPIRSCVHDLTETEMRVLRWSSEGLKPKRMSQLIEVKPETIHGYIANVREKLGAYSTRHMVQVARERGLLK